MDFLDFIEDERQAGEALPLSSQIFVRRPLDGSLTPVHQIYRAGTNIIIEMNIHDGKAVQ